MISKPSLTGSHQRTYDRIFQHPISHNLEWRDVHALFRELGEIVEEPNGNWKVTRNGQTLVLHATSKKDVSEMDEVMALRHFLERSDKAPANSNGKEVHWLLVIDHRQARIFHAEISDGIPLQILPHKADDYFRHAEDSKETSRGQEKPDPNSFFEPVAKALQAPGPILIFGTGTGAASEALQFVNWSKRHYRALAERIIGSLTVDEHHLSEAQLLAKAREFYATQTTAAAQKS
jgi:hypothetical protein